MTTTGNGGGRIVVINPNSTEAVTRGIDAAVQPLRFADGPVIDCVTLAEARPGSPKQAMTKASAALSSRAISSHSGRTTASASRWLSMPGGPSARETTTKPVVGIAEAAYATALQLGETFGVIAILENSVRRQRRHLRQLGLTDRYAASLAIGLGVTALEGDAVAERMAEVGRALVADHGAEVLILGCAGMARHRALVERALGVPVVDPSQAGAAQALAAVRLGYGRAG